MGAAAYRNRNVDQEDVDMEDLDFEEYVQMSDRTADYLKGTVGGQAVKDAEIHKYREGTILEPLNWLSDYVIRDDDVPDYDEILAASGSEYAEDVDVDELELDHLDAEGYEEDALEDYREAIERVLEG